MREFVKGKKKKKGKGKILSLFLQVANKQRRAQAGIQKSNDMVKNMTAEKSRTSSGLSTEMQGLESKNSKLIPSYSSWIAGPSTLTSKAAETEVAVAFPHVLSLRISD